MDKTTLKMTVLYNEMGKAEKRVADWLIANPGEILPLSIVDLAEKCGCSEATIVRFAKRLGFGGYQALKISLAQEGNTTIASSTISDKDSTEDIYNKVCNDIYCALEGTKNVLDTGALQLACQSIMKAKRIVIFGLGNSASVALDASHKLLRAGYNAYAYSDNHMQVIAASHLGEEDVAIAISHSGSSKDTVEALRLAKQSGAKTIAITNYGKSPIQKFGDVVLHTVSDETRHNILALNSRIAQLSIVNAIYYYLVYNQSETATESIRETERALLSKKY